MIGRIVRPVDFERTLAMPARSRSRHFSVHHLPSTPAPLWTATKQRDTELSTGGISHDSSLVDESLGEGVDACWLGSVVPKRHARRAVTRSLLKRQIRNAIERRAGQLPAGLWVVRLRSPIERTQFPSAASNVLKQTVRDELAVLLAGAAARRESPRKSDR